MKYDDLSTPDATKVLDELESCGYSDREDACEIRDDGSVWLDGEELLPAGSVLQQDADDERSNGPR